MRQRAPARAPGRQHTAPHRHRQQAGSQAGSMGRASPPPPRKRWGCPPSPALYNTKHSSPLQPNIALNEQIELTPEQAAIFLLLEQELPSLLLSSPISNGAFFPRPPMVFFLL